MSTLINNFDKLKCLSSYKNPIVENRPLYLSRIKDMDSESFEKFLMDIIIENDGTKDEDNSKYYDMCEDIMEIDRFIVLMNIGITNIDHILESISFSRDRFLIMRDLLDNNSFDIEYPIGKGGLIFNKTPFKKGVGVTFI